MSKLTAVGDLIPGWLMQWLNWGAAYPKGDEDELFALGDAWKKAAADLKNLEPELLAASNNLSHYYVGDGGAAAVKELGILLGDGQYSVQQLVASLDALGASARSTATEIEYTKIQEEIFAVMTLWGVLSLMYSAAGSALAPAYLVAARGVLEKFAAAAADRIGLIMARNAAKKMAAPLYRRIGVPLAKGLNSVNKAPALIKYPSLAAIGAGGGATIGAGMDAAIQGAQMLEGNRDNGYDLKRTFQTALEWGAGGAVGAPVHGLISAGMGKLIPSMLEKQVTSKAQAGAKLFGETVSGGLGGLAGGGGMYAAGLGTQYYDKGNWDDVDKKFHYQLALGGLGMGGLGSARHGMTPHDGSSHTAGSESSGEPKSNALGSNSGRAATAANIESVPGGQSAQLGSHVEAGAGKTEVAQQNIAVQSGAQHSGANAALGGQEPKAGNPAGSHSGSDGGRGGASAEGARSNENPGRQGTATENAQSRDAGAQNRPQSNEGGARNAAGAPGSERPNVAAGAQDKAVPRGPEAKLTGRESELQRALPESTERGASEAGRRNEVAPNHGAPQKSETTGQPAVIRNDALPVGHTPVVPAELVHNPAPSVPEPAAVRPAAVDSAVPASHTPADQVTPHNRPFTEPGARTPGETSAAIHRTPSDTAVPRPERVPESQAGRSNEIPTPRAATNTPAAERNPNSRADLPENRKQGEAPDTTGGLFPVPDPVESARPSDAQGSRPEPNRGNASDLGSFRGDARPHEQADLAHSELVREIEENLGAVKPEDVVWDPETAKFVLEDGTEIHVRVGETEPGTVARFSRLEETEGRGPERTDQPPAYEVTVSERARTEDVARAVAHEVAEIRLEQDPAILRDPISETPGQMTTHLGGRFAELRVLDAQLGKALKDPTRTNEQARLRNEIAEVLDELGMRDPATKQTPQQLLREHDPALAGRIEEKTPTLPKKTTEVAPPREEAEPVQSDETPARPGEHDTEAAWVSPEDPNLTLTHEQNRAADEFLARSTENEPKVTEAMQHMATETAAEMKGLEYRLKDEDSFKRKFATELEENGGDIAAALANMKDSVRYTATWETHTYTENVRAAEQYLRDQGFEPVKRKPTWGEEGYRGFNSFWKDSETGQVFEVQFHTPESFDAKMATHGLYDEIRLLPEGDPRRVELEAQQNEIFNSVPHPPGAETLVNSARPADHEAAHEAPHAKEENPAEQHPDESTQPTRPGEHEAEPAWVSPEDPNLTLTHEQNRAADEFLARSTENEPKVTEAMQHMATETAAEMKGLEYRLKDEDSFKRKLAGALDENGGDIAAALADMKDSVRYTATWETHEYTENVRAAERNLLDSGYEPVKRKPTWGDEGYRGFNSFWRDTETGQVFEVQFHTPESFDAKMRTHDLYDEIRLLPEGDPRRVELEAEQNAIFDSVPHPPGAETLVHPTRAAEHEATHEAPRTKDEQPTQQHPDETTTPAQPGEHNTEPGWVSPEDPNLTLTPEQNRAANEFLSRSTENEPKVTEAMQRMAAETGAEMKGLEYRLKDEDSFKRKFAGALEENGGDIAAALADMKDSVRYTSTWETHEYTENVRAAEQRLLDEGYEPVKRKPTWGDEGYRGFNSFWKDPETGQVFEVQFHTPESFDAKMRTHDLYDEIRLLPEGDPRRIALEAQQNAIFNSVPHPLGAETLSRPPTRTPPANYRTADELPTPESRTTEEQPNPRPESEPGSEPTGKQVPEGERAQPAPEPGRPATEEGIPKGREEPSTAPEATSNPPEEAAAERTTPSGKVEEEQTAPNAREAESEHQPPREKDETAPEEPRKGDEQIPRPVSSDELLNEYGMPKGNQEKFQEVANDHGVVLDVRPTNPATPAWLEKGALPKGLDIKVKTINELDPYIGASPENVGLVGFFEPTRPVEAEVPPHLWEEVNKRYDKRLAEWNEFQESMKEYGKKEKYVVEDGVVHGYDKDGVKKPLTGDHDVFDIRYPNGDRLPAKEYWAVVNDMLSRDMGVKHGAHMYWKTTGPPVHEGIYQAIIDAHKPGGEPLIRYSPDADPILVDSSTPVGHTVESGPLREPTEVKPSGTDPEPVRTETPAARDQDGAPRKGEAKPPSQEKANASEKMAEEAHAVAGPQESNAIEPPAATQEPNLVLSSDELSARGTDPNGLPGNHADHGPEAQTPQSKENPVQSGGKPSIEEKAFTPLENETSKPNKSNTDDSHHEHTNRETEPDSQPAQTAPSTHRPDESTEFPSLDQKTREWIEKADAKLTNELKAEGLTPSDIYGELPANHPGRVRVANVIENNGFPKKATGMDLAGYKFALENGGRGNPWKFANAFEYMKSVFGDFKETVDYSQKRNGENNQGYAARIFLEEKLSGVQSQLYHDMEQVRASGQQAQKIDPATPDGQLPDAVSKIDNLGFGDEVGAAYHVLKHLDELPSSEFRGKSNIETYQDSAAETVRSGSLELLREGPGGVKDLIYHRSIPTNEGAIVLEAIVKVSTDGTVRIASYGTPKAVVK
ncbi:hypothetical protein [Nocardia inohanensis]|uniref:WXG100-like domain-containing protein n=1 Tax=Nocardia inohanensis TaxID=209246 RepID=UPI00082A1152|nr:hypothetical protein [Nocardia inohanensis]